MKQTLKSLCTRRTLLYGMVLLVHLFFFLSTYGQDHKPKLSIQFGKGKICTVGMTYLGVSLQTGRLNPVARFLYNYQSLGAELQLAYFPLKPNSSLLRPFVSLSASYIKTFGNGFTHHHFGDWYYYRGFHSTIGVVLPVWKNFDLIIQGGPALTYVRVPRIDRIIRFTTLSGSVSAGISYTFSKGRFLFKNPRDRFPCLDSNHTKFFYFIRPGRCNVPITYTSRSHLNLLINAEGRYLPRGLSQAIALISFSAEYCLRNRIHPLLATDFITGSDLLAAGKPGKFISLRTGVRFIAAGNNKIQFTPEISAGFGKIELLPKYTSAVSLATFVWDAGLLFRFRLADFLWMDAGFGKHSINPLKHGYSDIGSIYTRAGLSLRLSVRKPLPRPE